MRDADLSGRRGAGGALGRVACILMLAGSLVGWVWADVRPASGLVGATGIQPGPTPGASATPEAGNAPSATPVPSPTATASPTARRPTLTPTPEPTPTPAFDFRLVSWRLWPLALNSGCEKGMHEIFIIVQDANGAPLDGVVVGDTYNNVEVVSGQKGPGRAEIDLWANTMEITVKRDQASGQPYTSQVSPPCSSFIVTIPDEQLVAAGYFANELEAQWNKENNGYHCGGHFSWEVIFQRTY